MPITENIHFIRAYNQYMQARLMVRQGLLGNASMARENLRNVYRFLAGKELIIK